MGDLNARHTSFGDHANNAYGLALLESLPSNGLLRLTPTSGRWTFYTPNQRSIVDHIFVNDFAVAGNAEYYVDEDIFVGSAEHSLLVGSINGNMDDSIGPIEDSRPFNRWRLGNPEVVERYLEHLNQSLDSLLSRMEVAFDQASNDAQSHADMLYDCFESWMFTALNAHIGRSLGRGRRPADFLTPELIAKENNLAEARRLAFNQSGPSGRRAELTIDYLECKARLDLEIAARREELFRSFADALQQMDVPAQLRLLHSMKRNKSQSPTNALQTDETSLARYRAHFASQYTNSLPPVLGPFMAGPDPIHDEMTCPFTLNSIAEHAKKMPSGKATGNSGLPSEAISVAAELVSFPLNTLFRFCFSHSVIPSLWKESRIHPILKKGSATDIRNYRPISLTEVVRRLFERILLDPLSSYIEPLSIEQGGFRASRGTIDQVATLQEWICQTKAKKLPRYMVFLDIKAAYDQVDRELLWNKCRAKGLPESLIKLLKSLFDGNMSCIAVAGAKSETFPLRSGLLQGSPLSPILYSLFIDDLVEELNGCVGTESLTLGGRRFRCLLYADDIVLMSTSWRDLCQLLKIAERHSLSNRYRFGVAKCEAVLSVTPSDTSAMTLYDEPIRCSTHFTYLGVPFSPDGILWKQHLETLGVKAQRVAGFFNSIGCNGQGFDTATCLRLYQCFVRPILEYGLALCPPSMLKTLDGLYGKCMRRMTSMGNTSSPLTIGMFAEIHPAKVRHTMLQYKYAIKTRRKPIVFSVNYALSAYNGKPTKNSCFRTWPSNRILNRQDRERFRARLERREATIEPALQIQDEMLEELLNTKSSAFIFRGKDRGKRKIFKRLFGKLNRVDQRLVLNWVTNRSVGRWKTCRNCGNSGADKQHLERCFWGEDVRAIHGGGPSKIEDELATVTNAEGLSRCVEAIRALVGDRPADGRGTEPP